MLKQIPISGDWIDPSTIVTVNALDGEKSRHSGAEHLPRVVVVGVSGGRDWFKVIDCEAGIQQARKIRDEIAGWANEAENA